MPVKVKYIPCIFEEKVCEFDSHNLSIPSILFSLIKKFPEVREDSACLSIRVNGEKISPYKLREIRLRDNDKVIIIQDVGFGIGEIALFTIFGYTVTIGTVLSALTVLSLAYSIYSMCVQPKGLDKPVDLSNKSPTYGWDGVKMSMQAGIPVPIVYGEHMVGGNLITVFVSSDGDKNFLNMLIAPCEGEIEGIMKEDLSGVCSSNSQYPYVLINDNLLSNFHDVEWDYRLGTQSQTIIPGFEDIKNTYDVGSPKITTSIPYNYTTVDNDVEAFELRFRIPVSYWQVKGSYLPVWTVWHVYHRIHGDPDWIDDGTTSISTCSQTALRRYFRKDGLTPNQYDIKITKESEDSNPPVYMDDLYLDSVVEIKYDSLAYPHTPLVSLKILGTDQISGTIPNVVIRLRARKVKNLNTSVIEWTRNPIWCVNDLIVTPRFGAGRYITQASINNDQLITMAAHCDEIIGDGVGHVFNSVSSTSLTDNDYTFVAGDVGKTLCVKSPNDSTVYTKMLITSVSVHIAYGTGGWSDGSPSTANPWEWGEKRYQLDLVIDSLAKASDQITTACSSFRAIPIWIKDAIQIIIEKKEAPTYIFNMGNIIEGSYQHSFGSEKQKINSMEIDFANQDKRYDREPMPIEEKEAFMQNVPKRNRKMSLFGATRRSQIYREGRFHIRSAQYQDESITFKGGIDAIHMMPFDVFKFQHDVPQWGFGGRIVSGTINSVTLDQSVTIVGGKTYVVCVKQSGAGGTETIETRIVSNGPGDYTTLNVTVDFSSVPQAYGLYQFGEQNIESKPFRVTKFSKTPENEIQIEAVEYSDNCYVDTDIVLPEIQYSSLPNPCLVKPVTNLEVVEKGIVLDDGTWIPYLEVGFTRPEDTGLVGWSHAEIYISISNDNFATETYEYYGKTDKSWGYKVENHPFLMIGQTVRVRAISVTKNGIRGTWVDSPYTDIVITGKVDVPPDVTGFSIEQLGDKLILIWNAPEDRDIAFYEIREGASWDVSQVIVTQTYGTSFNLFSFPGGLMNYMIKAVDRTGNYSTSPAQFQIETDSSSMANVKLTKDCLMNPTLSNTLLQYGIKNTFRVISLVPSQGWDDGGYWDDGSKWDIPVYPLSGYFESEIIDCDTKKVWLVVLDDMYLQDGDGQTATVKVRISDDNITWSAYAVFTPKEYNFRYIQFKVELATDNQNENIFVTKFTIQIGDSKLIGIRFSNQTIAVGGTIKAYGYTYGSVPSVQVTPIGSIALIPVITDLQVTQCTIKLFNKDGTDVGGTANISIEGF